MCGAHGLLGGRQGTSGLALQGGAKGAKNRGALTRAHSTVSTLALAVVTLGFCLPLLAASPARADGKLQVPGMDFSSLSPNAQKELGSVLDDEFCYCGCPHTLGQCLRNHKGCQHAKKAAALAAALAAQGAESSDIIIALSKYYLSFHNPRQTFQVDDRMCQGAKDAKVTLVEFSDFECPYCGAARPVLEAFVKGHKDVRLCYAPMPLQMHANAIPAGQAALFARDHGKFWQMHDALFENQRHLSPEAIKSLATKVGLDAAALQKVFDSGKYQDELRASQQVAREAGVDSTPTVFVNGRAMGLPPKAEFLERAVQDELEWTSHGNSWAPDAQ